MTMKRTEELSSDERAQLQKQQAELWRIAQAEQLLLSMGYLKNPDGTFYKPK